jgi:hypothetical protein
VLDACRDNPFADKGAKGLAPVDAPTGTFAGLRYGTGQTWQKMAAAATALYTKHLLAELQKPVSIEKRLQAGFVSTYARKSQGQQIPWGVDESGRRLLFHESLSPEQGCGRRPSATPTMPNKRPPGDKIKGLHQCG